MSVEQSSFGNDEDTSLEEALATEVTFDPFADFGDDVMITQEPLKDEGIRSNLTPVISRQHKNSFLDDSGMESSTDQLIIDSEDEDYKEFSRAVENQEIEIGSFSDDFVKKKSDSLESDLFNSREQQEENKANVYSKQKKHETTTTTISTTTATTATTLSSSSSTTTQNEERLQNKIENEVNISSALGHHNEDDFSFEHESNRNSISIDESQALHQKESNDMLRLTLTSYRQSQTMKSYTKSLRKVHLQKLGSIHSIQQYDLGAPSAINVKQRHIVIGTTQGVVMVFDFKQNLVQSFNVSPDSKAVEGRITSVDMDGNSNIVASGHAKGEIALWDFNSGSCIKVIKHLYEDRVGTVTLSQHALATLSGRAQAETITIRSGTPPPQSPKSVHQNRPHTPNSSNENSLYSSRTSSITSSVASANDLTITATPTNSNSNANSNPLGFKHSDFSSFPISQLFFCDNKMLISLGGRQAAVYLHVISWFVRIQIESRCLFSSVNGAVQCLSPLVKDNDSVSHFGYDSCLIAMMTMKKCIIIALKPQMKIIFNKSRTKISQEHRQKPQKMKTQHRSSSSNTNNDNNGNNSNRNDNDTNKSINISSNNNNKFNKSNNSNSNNNSHSDTIHNNSNNNSDSTSIKSNHSSSSRNRSGSTHSDTSGSRNEGDLRKSPVIPCLAWCHSTKYNRTKKKDQQTNPKLVFSWDRELFFIEVTRNESSHELKLVQKRSFLLPFSVVKISWIKHLLLVFTVDNKVHLIDPEEETSIEVIQLSPRELLFTTREVNIYGNPYKEYNQSVCSNRSQVFILGSKQVHMFEVMGRKQRLQSLVDKGKLLKALQSGIVMYETEVLSQSHDGNSVVNKPFQSFLSHLLKKYVHACFQQKREGLKKWYAGLCCFTIHYCISLQLDDLLFGELYDDMISIDTCYNCFHYSLVHFILDNRLRSLPPTVMQNFFSFLEFEKEFALIEKCLLCLDMMNVNIDELVHICTRNNFQRALIHIYNNGLKDYYSPMIDQLALLKKLKDEDNRKEELEVGNRLLLYLSCCLSGQAYPIGILDEKTQLTVKTDGYAFILNRITDDNGIITYPNLDSLLHFDSNETLHVLELAMAEKHFDLVDKFGNAIPMTPEKMMLPDRQLIVDILLQCLPLNEEVESDILASIFLARQVVHYPESILLEQSIKQKIVSCLCSVSVSSKLALRQESLIGLFKNDHLKGFNSDRLLLFAEKCHFFQMCEYLYMKMRRFSQVLSCYLRDETRQRHVFACLENLINEANISNLERKNLENFIFENLSDFLSIDAEIFCQTIYDIHLFSLDELIKMLKYDEESLFLLLNALYLKLVKNNDFSSFLSDEIHERFISMICRREPKQVLNYFQNDCACDYRKYECLKICTEYEVVDASAFLLSKCGDTEGAINMLCEWITGVFSQKDLHTKSFFDQKGKDFFFQDVNRFISLAVDLCRKISDQSSKAEILWLALLRTFIESTNEFLGTCHSDIQSLIGDILNGMMGYVSMSTITKSLLEERGCDSLGEMKEVVMTILETYEHEQTLYELTNKIMSQDNHSQTRMLAQRSKKAAIANGDTCNLCGLIFLIDSSNLLKQSPKSDVSVILFACGHAFHAKCIYQLQFSMCPTCAKKKSQKKQNSSISVSLENPSSSTFANEKLLQVIETEVGFENGEDYCNNQEHLLENLERFTQDMKNMDKKSRQLQEAVRDDLEDNSQSRFLNQQSMLKLAPPLKRTTT